MHDAPLTTFTLYAKKPVNVNEIRWECKVNSMLLGHASWKFEINSIALTNIVHPVKQEPAAGAAAAPLPEEKSPIFEIYCNLVTNNFKWFESIIGRYGQKQLYKELYPIEHVQMKGLNNDPEHLIFFKNKKHHINTPSQDEMVITMSPMKSTYKFKDITCEATVMISLYKA